MASSTRSALLAVLAGAASVLALVLRRQRGARADVQVWHDATTDRP